ncbi:MAG: ThuA domain-containing protein [Verrucomicrobiales bacterium]|nr:ThuA domain-containing protein [Verrucomicrobiales bacterium]
MKHRYPTFLILILAVFATGLVMAQNQKGKSKKKENPKKEFYSGDPIKALIITGGCCHNYLYQTYALGSAVQAVANVDFEIVKAGGNGTDAQISLYNDPDWAKPYDVVIHNECFADTVDPEYIRRITSAHHGGVPAIVVHCAMHTYRSAEIDDWREFLGVTSRRHDHQSRYPVTVIEGAHPIMKGFPTDWVTPMDELYIIEKLWPNATALASSVSEKDGQEYPVIWANDFGGTRVVGTTYGHSDETFGDPVFTRMLARAILWAAGKEAGDPPKE